MSTSTLERVYGECAQDHRELMELVGRIRELRSIVGLAPLLENLHGLLIRHFSQEHFPGRLYECMGAYGSAHHEELKILSREHCVILSAMRGLLDRTLVSGARDDPAVMKEVGEVLVQLGDHERREYTLAQKLMALGQNRNDVIGTLRIEDSARLSAGFIAYTLPAERAGFNPPVSRPEADARSAFSRTGSTLLDVPLLRTNGASHPEINAKTPPQAD